MKNINEIHLAGNVGGDVKYSAKSEIPVLSFSLGTNTSRNGSADWHNMVGFGEVAVELQSKLKKGDYIELKGYVKNRTWTDDNNIAHHGYQVVISKVLDVQEPMKHKQPGE